MSNYTTSNYIEGLERLILNQLLPIYEDYYIERGEKCPYVGFPSELLREISTRSKVPALLKPKQKVA